MAQPGLDFLFDHARGNPETLGDFQVRRLFQSVRGAAHSANNPNGCPASAQRGHKKYSAGTKRAEPANTPGTHSSGIRSPGMQKTQEAPHPYAGNQGRILRFQFR